MMNKIIITVILLVAVGAISVYLLINQDTSKPIEATPSSKTPSSINVTPDATQKPTTNLKANFSQEGNLIDARKTAGTWLLMFDDPNNPTAQAVLLFNESSMCDLGGGMSECEENKFIVGDRITVTGNEKDAGVVTVITLKKLAL